MSSVWSGHIEVVLDACVSLQAILFLIASSLDRLGRCKEKNDPRGGYHRAITTQTRAAKCNSVKKVRQDKEGNVHNG